MKIIQNSLKIASFAGILKLSSLIKVSFLLGSQMIWFTGINSVLPLSGAFGGILGASCVFIVRQFLHLLFFKTISLSFLALCVPGFCASLYWSANNALIRLLLPLACMGLFVAHPIGGQAFFYSLYWLIPVALYFFPQRSVFAQALGSTFIAHAVGSVIWCYTVPMTAHMWMALMPIVIIERVLFAVGMVVAYHAISYIFSKIENIFSVRTLRQAQGERKESSSVRSC